MNMTWRWFASILTMRLRRGVFTRLEAARGDSPALHMQFGLAYGNSDFTPHAVTEFKKVIAEDPHYPGAHYSVAAALLAAGEDEKTLQEAEARAQAGIGNFSE